MQLALAPMEGLVDEIHRDVLTRVGGIDWCVTEFIRVNEVATPASVIRRYAPELAQGAVTPAGTEMRVQLLGSNPETIAESAAIACTLGAPVIDLNFGCPAKTVNKSRGGAVLLKEPELLHAIVSAVRRALPADIPVTAKMRLGFDHADDAETCAQALADGGAASIVVHARTKVDGYKPPAYWERIGGIRDAVKVPVFANGEVWSVEDWQRCRSLSGVDDVMLGRGMIARPDLARQIAALRDGREVTPMGWAEMQPILARYWDIVCAGVATPRYAPGLLKQWLVWLARSYPEAAALFVAVRALTSIEAISALLAASAPAVELGR